MCGGHGLLGAEDGGRVDFGGAAGWEVGGKGGYGGQEERDRYKGDGVVGLYAIEDGVEKFGDEERGGEADGQGDGSEFCGLGGGSGPGRFGLARRGPCECRFRGCEG